MKYSIAKEHKDFFEKEGWIEFEDLLSATQLQQLNQTIDAALAKRLDLSPDKMKKLSSHQLFLQGRDLWRSNETLRKLVCQPRLAEIAARLVEQKSLRLGYDQLIPSTVPSLFQTLTHQSDEKFIEEATTLAEVSCVKEVAAGVLICLGPATVSQDEFTHDEFTHFGQGHVVFFRPDTPLILTRLRAHPQQRYFLIVYTEFQANYVLELRDPHTHDLKNLGFVFNDRLTDRSHPIVHR